MTLQLGDPVEDVAGVGRAVGERLRERLGVATVGDLVTHWPREHLDLGPLASADEAVEGEQVTLVGTVRGWERHERRGRGGNRLRVAEAWVDDDTGRGEFRVTLWNQPGAPRRFPVGSRVVVSGTAKVFREQLQFSGPKVGRAEDADPGELDHRLVPQYPATEGLPTARIERLVASALDALGPLPEHLPPELLAAEGLRGWDESVRAFHAPTDEADLRSARARLEFDELLLLQVGLRWRRARLEAERPGVSLPPREDGLAAALLASLPFEPTGAQRRAMGEVGEDLARPTPMHRLLQGDVGAGKTLVAAWALLCAVDHGRQGALLAPTEVLAEQHLRTLLDHLAPLGVNVLDGPRVELLTGSSTATTTRRVLAELAGGQLDLLVGTHALLEERVAFADLGVVVVDEQHRFGVDQRTELSRRSTLDDTARTPDVLVMTATPIPRSLSLTVYGDLEVTVLDELPPGREPVRTQLITPAQRERRARLERFVVAEAAEGRQTYWVCPLVEPSSAIEAADATTTAQELARRHPGLRVGLVHGRMSSADKEAAMASLRAGDTDVLVATTVIEVGVDVPTATTMVIEDAERFGISQLHQLRGRVGRGGGRSWCVLFAGWHGELTEDGLARLEAVAGTTDGFELAERDLQLRGGGTLLGTAQSGRSDLRLARMGDLRLLARTRRLGGRLVEADPDLDGHARLRAELARRYGGLETFAALSAG